MEVLVLWEYEGWEVRILSSVNRIINSVYVVKNVFWFKFRKCVCYLFIENLFWFKFILKCGGNF